MLVTISLGFSSSENTVSHLGYFHWMQNSQSTALFFFQPSKKAVAFPLFSMVSDKKSVICIALPLYTSLQPHPWAPLRLPSGVPSKHVPQRPLPACWLPQLAQPAPSHTASLPPSLPQGREWNLRWCSSWVFTFLAVFRVPWHPASLQGAVFLDQP